MKHPKSVPNDDVITQSITHHRLLLVVLKSDVDHVLDLVGVDGDPDRDHTFLVKVAGGRHPLSLRWCVDRQPAAQTPNATIPLTMVTGPERLSVVPHRWD